jgi:acetylornithine deacetylase/succinyl-diaminopimelate desuccinylase-like protein
MDSFNRFNEWYRQHRSAIREDYFTFLRFPSISADPEYRKEVLACARWLTEYFVKGGIRAEEILTPGYPIVYAEDLSAGPGKPTVLIYGHYDVQPVDPLELWKSPPFEPTEREGKIFARGAVDDKGQIFYACLAAICWKKLGLPLPVNLKFCIEGEEESSSMGLAKALPHLKEKLKADSLLIVDFDSAEDGTPSLTLGARGCVSLEVTLTGSKSDLHSGLHGGLAYNPNRALAELLSKLWDENGRVAVPGFYDDVEVPKEEDLSRYPFRFTKEHLATEFGIEALGCEKGKTLREANWFRPTLEINGMVGGYTGAGMKTVIPAHASAKISCRLVLHQDPMKICRAVGDFLQKEAVKGMKVKVDLHGGIGAFQGNPNSSLAKAVTAASTQAVGKKCVNALSGASIPIAADLVRILKTEVVGMGYGLATDDIHAPNEHFDMERFEKGFLTVARAIELL